MIILKLIDLLKNLPTKSTNYGNLVLHSDIINACKLYGQDNHQLVDQALIELETQGQLKMVYMDNDPCVGLIVGIQLNSKA